MRRIELGLNGTIYWRVHSSLTRSPPIPAIGGWSVAYPHALPPTHQQRAIDTLFGDGTVLCASETLVLVSDDGVPLVAEVPALAELVLPYLNALRVVAKQPELPRSVVFVTSVEEVQETPDVPTSVLARLPVTTHVLRAYPRTPAWFKAM